MQIVYFTIHSDMVLNEGYHVYFCLEVHFSDRLNSLSFQEAEPAHRVEDAGQGTGLRDLNRKVFAFVYFMFAWKVMNFVSDHAFEKQLETYKACLGMVFMDTEAFAALLPTTMYAVLRCLDIKDKLQNFKRYVPCSRCHHLYTMDDIIARNIMNCNQPVYKRRKLVGTCGKALVTKNGRGQCSPIYQYRVFDIAEKLQLQLQRPGYEQLSEQWRDRTEVDGVYSDVYDGNAWKKLRLGDHAYGLMLNIDWYQPYENRKNSIGMVYLANMNLPREIRHKRENVIVVSVIPDFEHEPSCISTYLEPIVQQLKELWQPGVKMTTSEHPEGVIVKAALVCTSADVPATRKLSGFLGHNALYGCTMCKHKFTGGVGNKNFSGFEKQHWVRRTYSSHKAAVKKINAAKTEQEKTRLERETGYR